MISVSRVCDRKSTHAVVNNPIKKRITKIAPPPQKEITILFLELKIKHGNIVFYDVQHKNPSENEYCSVSWPFKHCLNVLLLSCYILAMTVTFTDCLFIILQWHVLCYARSIWKGSFRYTLTKIHIQRSEELAVCLASAPLVSWLIFRWHASKSAGSF